MPKVQTLSALAKAGALSGKRVFIRADLNVPFDDAGRISEDTRIRASVPGIRLALDAGAAVMVTSHLGRPKEGVLTEADSLAKVGQRLSELLGMPVPLVQNWVDGVKVDAGQVVLLENCRVNVGEKKDDEALAGRWPRCATSTSTTPSARRTAPRPPRTASLVSRRWPAPVRCWKPSWTRWAAPCMSPSVRWSPSSAAPRSRPSCPSCNRWPTRSTSWWWRRHRQHLHAGRRTVDRQVAGRARPVDQARAVIELMKQRGADVPIPVDVVCAKSFGADAEATVKAAEDVADDDMILDIGPQTAAQLAEILKQAGTIVWNGPVGVFEFDQFAHGTEVVARAIAGSEGFSIAGGGDTLAAIAKYGIGEQVGYISTGGGAFLEFRKARPCRPWPCWKPAPPEYRLTHPAGTPVPPAAGPAFFLVPAAFPAGSGALIVDLAPPPEVRLGRLGGPADVTFTAS